MPDFNFWNERWKNGQIGFHLLKPHDSLVEFYQYLKPHKNIFVPLCGKSQDMIFLRSLGHNVIGVEFSKIAIEEFIKENNLVFETTTFEKYSIYQTDGFKIYQGDLFDLTASELPGVTAIYDRASMVAFNLKERMRYSQFLNKSLPDLEVILSPLLDYGKFDEDGPPYSVTGQELKDLYSNHFKLTELKSTDVSIRDNLKLKGASYEREVTWLFTR